MMIDKVTLSVEGLFSLKRQGLNLREVLHKAGLPETTLNSEQVCLSVHDYYRLWSAINAIGQDSFIGLRLAENRYRDCLEAGLLTALHAENGIDAVRLLSYPHQVQCLETFKFHCVEDATIIEIEWPSCELSPPEILIDNAFATLKVLISTGTGKDIQPLFIERTCPSFDVQSHAQYFGCIVCSGARRDVMVYRSVDLKRAFVTSQAQYLNVLLPDMSLAQNTWQVAVKSAL